MAHLIDTSVFVALERRGLPLGALASVAPRASDAPVALASSTASELLVGVHAPTRPRAGCARRSWRRCWGPSRSWPSTCGWPGRTPGCGRSSPRRDTGRGARPADRCDGPGPRLRRAPRRPAGLRPCARAGGLEPGLVRQDVCVEPLSRAPRVWPPSPATRAASGPGCGGRPTGHLTAVAHRYRESRCGRRIVGVGEQGAAGWRRRCLPGAPADTAPSAPPARRPGRSAKSARETAGVPLSARRRGLTEPPAPAPSAWPRRRHHPETGGAVSWRRGSRRARPGGRVASTGREVRPRPTERRRRD